MSTDARQFQERSPQGYVSSLLQLVHIDWPLLLGLLALCGLGLAVLFSAGG